MPSIEPPLAHRLELEIGVSASPDPLEGSGFPVAAVQEWGEARWRVVRLEVGQEGDGGSSLVRPAGGEAEPGDLGGVLSQDKNKK